MPVHGESRVHDRRLERAEAVVPVAWSSCRGPGDIDVTAGVAKAECCLSVRRRRIPFGAAEIGAHPPHSAEP